MSYEKVLQALEPGDCVTFNDSGGALGKVPPELWVQEHTNSAFVELLDEARGEWWRVKKNDDGELVLQYDRDSRKNDGYRDWRDYDTIETIELIAESDSRKRRVLHTGDSG